MDVARYAESSGSRNTPYPHAWRYQKVNADFLAEHGAAIRINDEDMQTELLPNIRVLANNSAKLDAMREAAKRLDKEDAASHIADMLIRLVKN